jgi:hypothetical protein
MLAGGISGAIVREAFPVQKGGVSQTGTRYSMSKATANFIHALIAVLAGNGAYFLLMKYLPPRARHAPFQIDLGLVVDFWFCLVVFGIIKTIAGRSRRSNRSS